MSRTAAEFAKPAAAWEAPHAAEGTALFRPTALYYVSSVTSTLKRSQFKQSFSLTRNGLIPITPVPA